MLRRNSFFIKILIPVIIVMLLQIGIIAIALSGTGTITALEDAEVLKLTVNAQTRGAALEQMMVHYWANLDRLEMGVTEYIGAYLTGNGLAIDDVLGDYDHEINILGGISHNMIDTLRASVSTGIYVILLDKEGLREEPQARNGLYYRDLDPLSNPADNSDIIFLKGFIDIARKDKIQLDSIWSEQFAFDPAFEVHWRSFANPQIAAAGNPGVSSVNLAYWNGPHLVNPQSVLDANPCITYTRPVLYEGRPVALIGSEVQLVQLEKYFPASDFESTDRNGYMLLNLNNTEGEEKNGSIYFVNGGYIKRLAGAGEDISVTPTHREGVYAAAEGMLDEGVQIALRPMRLYNLHAPFSGEQWALAAVGTDNMLFRMSRNINIGITTSFVFSFVFGSVMIAVVVRRATKPLIAIADKIERSGHGSEKSEQFETDRQATYEINLLCSTLNQMQERRNRAEELVREERRRYLIALESATNTFMEYDVGKDIFMLYYFIREGSGSLQSKTINDFKQAVSAGEFCHPDDIPVILNYLKYTESAGTATLEIRAKISVFSHIEAAACDGEYYWFTIKTSNIISNSEGKISKIIGTAKEITEEKLARIALEEAARRDSTTKFYNREYGMEAISRNAAAAAGEKTPYLLCAAAIENFDKLESFYGRVFGAFVLMELSRALMPAFTEQDIAVRLSNDEFLFYFHGAGGNEGNAKMAYIEDTVSSLYAGENTNIALTAHVRNIALTSGIDICGTDIGGQNGKNISIQMDVSKANIVGAAFDLFERTSDVHSSINILLGTLGHMFGFCTVAVCTYDAGFGANKVAYQWALPGLPSLSGNIERISHTDAADFEALLYDDDTLLFTEQSAAQYSDGVRKLICADAVTAEDGSVQNGTDAAGSGYSAYCCVMFENAAHTGRVIFFRAGSGEQWDEKEQHDLCDIVKIISAHISIDKSRSASRAKSEFLSRVSHEIRTPMNAIIGMTDIAKSVTDDPGRLSASLNQIDFSAKHLLTLINDVLEMSRIESGKLQIENRPFTIDSLISGIETLMRVPIENNGVKFTVRKDYSQSHVKGDEYRLRQVLVNLLGNANKFTEKGGEITLTVRQLDGGQEILPRFRHRVDDYGIYRFSVADTGIGISAEDQLHVFEAFEQASETGSARQEGTGLGLAISGSIVSAMGGKIELDSKPGEGSEFSFILRMELFDPGTQAVTPGDENEVDYTGRFKGKRALLVDDVSTNVAVAAHILGDTGIAIEVAYDGQQAVDMFTISPPGYYDIIFMDVKMPVMDGFDATRIIRGNRNHPDARSIPIVAMTANAYDEDMKKTVESGMNGHITKPIERDKLFELMAELI